MSGRAPNVDIIENGQAHPIEDWCTYHIQRMQPLAALLDSTDNTTLYTDALKAMMVRVDEVDATLSALMVGDTREQGGMWHFGQALAQQHVSAYEQHQMSAETLAYFEQAAKVSIQKQQQLEQDSTVSFAEYLAQYR